ncbi:MAG: TonB-dependent receptor plug domain-containing protein [Gammaproteobacteria bacterium]
MPILQRRSFFPRFVAVITAQHRPSRAMALATGALAWLASASIGHADSLSEAAYLEDVPVVLSATRLSQPITEAPAAVTVIDRAMIEASGFRQIADLLRLVPGFTVAYFNGYTPSVTYHGFADEFSERMQVLIDGRSVYLPSIGGVDWSDLPITIDDIERMEVIRGPDSAAYGANSFLGVISITTRHPAEDKGVAVKLNYGQHNVRDVALRYGARAGALYYHVSLGQREDDGFDNRYDSARVALLNSQFDYQLGDNDNLEAALGLAGGPHQNGETSDPTEPPHIKNINTHFEQLRWRHSNGPMQEFRLQFYHNYHNTADDFLTAPLSALGGLQLSMHNSIRAERYDLEFQHTLSPQRNLRLVWGGSAREDQVTAAGYFASNQTFKTRLTRLFGNAEWRVVPSVVVNVGATLERNDLTGTHLSPRLAGNWHLDAHQTLRAVISTAIRTPLLFEDRGDYKIVLPAPLNVDQVILGGGSLGNENILSRELGYLFDWPERGMALDVKLFDDVLKDLIVRDYCKDIPGCLSANSGVPDYDHSFLVYHNAQSKAIHGIEFQWEQRFSVNTRLILGYAHVLIPQNDDLTKYQSTPKDSVHALLMQNLPADTEASVGYYRNEDMEYLGSGNHTDIQQRIDARVAHTFKRGSDKLQVALVVQNPIGSYQDFWYTKNPAEPRNLFDRRAFVQLSYELP